MTLAEALEAALIGQATKADVIAACDAELNGSRPTAGRKETEMRVSKFTRKSAVYVCVVCEKQTRETGDGESSVEMCADCYEWESMLNQHGDDGHDGKIEDCQECMTQMKRPANKAKKTDRTTELIAALKSAAFALETVAVMTHNAEVGKYAEAARAVLAKYAGKEE